MACCCNNRGQNRCNCGCNRTFRDECTIQPVSGCRQAEGNGCEWFPLETTTSDIPMRICSDQSGVCGMFPEACRNTFWPDFCHPRWLCCRDLYCARKKHGC